MAWFDFPVFVALSTFGAVNGILLTSSRLFYAGANNGQMPEILTMIQIQRFTPTPAVLAMALLSMLYLTVSDIFALINYVGFATWVSWAISFARSLTNHKFPPSVEYWRSCFVPALAEMGPTQSAATYPSAHGVPHCLSNRHHVRDRGAHVRQSHRDRIWHPDDPVQHTCLSGVHRLEEQAYLVPEDHG